MKLHSIPAIKTNWPTNNFLKTPKGGTFRSKRLNQASEGLGISQPYRTKGEEAVAQRQKNLRDKARVALASLRDERAATKQRLAIRELVNQIPHDNAGWGRSKDGSGVWYKTRNKKGHLKTHKISL